MGSESLVGTEVPIIGSYSVKWVEVSVPISDALSDPDRGGSTPSMSAPHLEDAACCSVIGSPPTYLIWKIHKSLPNVLEVLELSADKEFPRIGLHIHFEEALFPFACICQNEFSDSSRYPYLLYALSVSGIAYCLRLKNISSYASWSGFSIDEVIQLDVQNFPPHAPVCAVTTIAGCLVIGREDGSIASYRIGSLDQNALGLMREMRDDAGFGRLWGLVSRGRMVGSVKALNIANFHGRKLVFVLHSDGNIKIWDLFSGAKIFTLTITGTSFENLWVGEAISGTGVIPLAILFKEALVSSERICICKLNVAHGDKITSTQDILPLSEGELIDVKLASNKIWVLKEDQLIVQDLLHLNSKVEGDCYALQQAFVAEQLFQISDQCLDDLFQLTCTIFSCQKAQTIQFLSSIFLRRLLNPGVHNSCVLHNVFEQYGKFWTDAEFQALTVDGLRKEILSLIEHEAISGSPYSIFKCWKDFCSRYFECWRKINASFGLMVDSRTGAVGVIRENSLSLFRNLERIELVSCGDSTNLDDFAKIGLEISKDMDFELLLEVLHCNHKLSQRLGGAVSPILYEALVSFPVVPFDDIVPIILKMLESGCNFSVAALQLPAVGADMVKQKQMAENKNLRRFSVDMLLSLQALHRQANGWGAVLDVIERYVQFLVPITVGKNLNSNMPSNITTSAVVQAASQVAKAMFESALDVLLFLRYLLNISGQIHLFQQERTKIQHELIPMIHEVVMDWLIIFFIATTPSESGAVEDFSSQLSSLRIDGSIGKASWTEKLGSFSFTLAFVLSTNADCQNSRPFGSLPSPGNFVSLVRNFTRWIMFGTPEEIFFSIFEHSANLALILLKHAQYNAAETILQITVAHLRKEKTSESIQQADKEWSLLHHLLGCCLVSQAHFEPHGELRERKICEALTCFFRASSGEKAAHSLQRLPPEAGCPYLGFNGCESPASWRFHYYQWAMQMFEQYNMSQAACQFALAALEQVDEAVSHNEHVAQDVLSGESTITIKGRLWANVFKFMLDLNEFYDAYCAMVSNPDEESKDICLRRLIIVLYECGATKMLCNGQLPFISLTEKAERELAQKAARFDTVAKANPFKLLYAFEMHRQNWRKAASYMYLFSTQLKNEIVLRSVPNSTLVIQERLNAISSAINALKLLPPAHAWIDLHIDGSYFHNDFHLNKKARTSENQSASVDTRSPGSLSFVGMEKLEDEYVLTSAEHLLSLANVKWSHTGSQMPPSDLVDHLVQADLYDMAFSVLLRFWNGSGLNKGLESVFCALSLKCSPDKSISAAVGSNRLLLKSLKDEELTTEAFDVNPPVKQSKGNSQWEVLEIYLEKYKRFHPRLPLVVAETLLKSDSQIELPLWLVHMFKGGHKKAGWGMAGQEPGAASLLCLYVDYGRYTEATDILIEYLEAYRSARPEDLVRRKSPFAAWFPYITIERLWCQLEASIRAGYMIEQCEKLKSLIHGVLQSHLHTVKEDSKDAISSFHL